VTLIDNQKIATLIQHMKGFRFLLSILRKSQHKIEEKIKKSRENRDEKVDDLPEQFVEEELKDFVENLVKVDQHLAVGSYKFDFCLGKFKGKFFDPSKATIITTWGAKLHTKNLEQI
jgi:hypothetical protein